MLEDSMFLDGAPATDSNRGPIDYKSKSFLKFPFINVDITNF